MATTDLLAGLRKKAGLEGPLSKEQTAGSLFYVQTCIYHNSSWLHPNLLKMNAFCTIFRGEPEFRKNSDFSKILEIASVATSAKFT